METSKENPTLTVNEDLFFAMVREITTTRQYLDSIHAKNGPMENKTLPETVISAKNNTDSLFNV